MIEKLTKKKKSIIEEHEKTINVLNKHATAIVNSQFHFGNKVTNIHVERNLETPLGQLHIAFKTFVSAVEENEFRSNYLSDLSAPETIAYRSFFDKLAKLPS